MKTCLLQNHSAKNEKLYQLTLPNHAAYAGVHRYDLLSFNWDYSNLTTLVWRGLFLLRRLLLEYDVVCTAGSDVIFTDLQKPLAHFVDPDYGAIMSLEEIGGSPVNNDLMLWQRGEKVIRVLDRMATLWGTVKDHPWEVQQSLNIMRTEGTTDVKFLPCRELQSTPVRSFPKSAWRPGDFALHFLAMDNEDKYKRCEHFLRTGEVLWRD